MCFFENLPQFLGAGVSTSLCCQLIGDVIDKIDVVTAHRVDLLAFFQNVLRLTTASHSLHNALGGLVCNEIKLMLRNLAGSSNPLLQGCFSGLSWLVA